jgi:hypothetical protein
MIAASNDAIAAAETIDVSMSTTGSAAPAPDVRGAKDRVRWLGDARLHVNVLLIGQRARD